MGEMEIGNCCVCGKKGVPVRRKVYEYPIKTSGCYGRHVIVICYCEKCNEPKEPEETSITFKTEDLKDYERFKSLFIKN